MAINKKILHLNLAKGSSWSTSTTPTELTIKLKTVVNEEKIQKAYDILKNKDYVPSKKDKLYLFPGCIVPRFKIREMWKPLGVSVTIKKDNGTHKFISSDYYKYIEAMGNSYSVPAKMIKFWLDNHSADFEKYGLNHLNYKEWDQEYLDEFNNLIHQDDNVYLNYSFNTLLRDRGQSLLGETNPGGTSVSLPVENYDDLLMNIKKHIPEDELLVLQDEENLVGVLDLPITYENVAHSVYNNQFKEDVVEDVIEDILNGNDSSYYLDESINKSLQNCSPIIDEDMYDQMCNLFKSLDRDNHVLAMEVIANCNVEKSAIHVFSLMRDFKDVIRYNRAYNSVNFKAFRESSGLDVFSDYGEEALITFLYKYSQLDINVIRNIQETATKLINRIIENTYGNLINQDILTIKFPYCKVVIKGINDGSQNLNIVDVTEEKAKEDIKENPEAYGISETVHILDNIDEVNPDDEELIEGVTEALEELSIISEDVCEVDHVAESENIPVNDLDKEENDTLENLEDLEFKADEEMQETKTEEIQNEKDKEDKEDKKDNWWENSLETNVTPVDDDFDFD